MKSLIERVKVHFKLGEFVSYPVLHRYPEAQCWSFLDPKMLENILWLRVTLKRRITINNYLWRKGGHSQRGIRENTCNIVKNKTVADKLYVSDHVLGRAIDFDVEGMSAEEVRKFIVANQSRLPHPVRLEHKMKNSKGIYTVISWVHMGVSEIEGQPKVYLFNV